MQLIYWTKTRRISSAQQYARPWTARFLLGTAPLGLEVENQDGMKAAARKIVEMGARAVVVTGGHLEKAVDVYSMARSSTTRMGPGAPSLQQSPRI